MTVDTLLIILGAFVAILPFLGFPQSWDKILFLIAGILILALGIVVRRSARSRTRSKNRGSFSDEVTPLHEEESLQ